MMQEATTLEEAGNKQEAVTKLEALLKSLKAAQKEYKLQVYSSLESLITTLYEAKNEAAG